MNRHGSRSFTTNKRYSWSSVQITELARRIHHALQWTEQYSKQTTTMRTHAPRGTMWHPGLRVLHAMQLDIQCGVMIFFIRILKTNGITPRGFPKSSFVSTFCNPDNNTSDSSKESPTPRPPPPRDSMGAQFGDERQTILGTDIRRFLHPPTGCSLSIRNKLWKPARYCTER